MNEFSIKNKPDLGVLPQYDDISLYETEQQRHYAGMAHEFADIFINEPVREPAQMEEYFFKNVFLPYFCGDPVNPEVGEIKEGNWTSFAGSPFMPVNIVDRAGNFLFQVPPRFDHNSLAPSKVNDMNNYVTVSDQHRNLLTAFPAEAHAFITSVLDERTADMRTNIRTIDHLYAWNKIFKRYDRPLIMFGDYTEEQLMGLAPLDAPKETVVKETQQSDDFEYGSF